MTVDELKKKLKDVPGDWQAFGNSAGSITVVEDRWRLGTKYGYVFTDDRPTQIMVARK